MACQAVTAKFSNIKFNSNWTKDRASKDKIIHYLLNKVASKILLAKIIGTYETNLSLELYDHSNKDKPINLNELIVKEGMGEWYDEKKEINFRTYEQFRDDILGVQPQDSFLKRFENALNVFEKTKSSRNSAPKENRVDENNNNTSLNSKNEEDSLQSRQLKTKLVVYFDSDKKKIYRLNLVDVNNVIYVHWTQVAILFGLSKNAFKDILKLRIKEHDSSLDDLYVKIFILCDQNNELFDTIQNDFNIDLESIQETEELFMLKFYCLYIIASDILDEEYSKSLENFITNNKVTGKNVNPELFQEYKKYFNSGCSSEKSLESRESARTDSLVNISCDPSQVSVSDLMNIISMLKTSLIFYEENQNAIKIQKTKSKISFYEKKLNELYNNK